MQSFYNLDLVRGVSEHIILAYYPYYPNNCQKEGGSEALGI